jgi:hypothetical protein
VVDLNEGGHVEQSASRLTGNAFDGGQGTPRRVVRRASAALAGIATCALCALAPATAGAAAQKPVIEDLSSRADLISGGDTLLAIALPPKVKTSKVSVSLNGQNVTTDFAVRANGRYEGLVSGLLPGANVLTVTARHARPATITLTNHPIGGPVIFGPQRQPWFCESGAVDAQCNKPAEVTYWYKSTNREKNGLQPYDPSKPATDVESTTTDQGVTVPYIVRREIGYQDRDQVAYSVLAQPGEGWARWSPPRQWNHKLLVTHGASCGTARGTGNAPSVLKYDPLDDVAEPPVAPPNQVATDSVIQALGSGYAVMSTALDNNGHNCDIALQAESLMMAKENFIKAYGDVRFTIGTGCSGGSIAEQQVANAYPGAVYDGLIPTCAYPDDLSPGAEFFDYHMLRLYFESPSKWGTGVAWSPTQWAAVEGRPDFVNAIVADEAFFKSATNPEGCLGAEGYNAETNISGVRCDVLDAMINVLGPRPESVWSENERKLGHGFAGIPIGNVGIQYGLNPLESGLITAEQFLDLNEKIGGESIDYRAVPQRTPGDNASVANAYRSGGINEANNLSGVAIIDAAGPDPGAAHDTVHTWWLRNRLQRAQGYHGNDVIWWGPTPLVGNLNWMAEALSDMDRWLTAVEGDHSAKSRAEKILADRPAEVHDRCKALNEMEGLPTEEVCPPGATQARFGTPRTAAGEEGEAGDINKCQRKPLVRSDYPATVIFTEAQWERLKKIFPEGVCDWSKPGVGQQPSIPWQTYQSADGSVIYGGTQLGAPPASH